ncbi:MAG: hypothetical protein HPY44_13015 [Armatimonadetes bacterium]|nr:hypothetical protein [Armatimonadota bacterium]
MSLLRDIQSVLIDARHRRIAGALQAADPGNLVARGERRLLQVFHRAAKLVPAYRELLRASGVDPFSVRSARDFAEVVPVLDKEKVFVQNRLRDLCVGGTLEEVASFHCSSGHSGVFSYGVETWRELVTSARQLELSLDLAFKVRRRKTLIINCLPMGVKVRTCTVPVADTSVRSDVVLALIEKLTDDFEQFIIIGESLFLKKVLEDGVDRGTPWSDLLIHVVTGGEFIAESMRSYFAQILGLDFDAPDRGAMLVSMGLSELGLSLFSETPELVSVRRRAQEDERLCAALGGRPNEAFPVLMQYNPLVTFVETIANQQGFPQLIVSILGSEQKIPLLRYNTRDEGQLLSYSSLHLALQRCGCEALLPKFPLPCALVSGRKQRVEIGKDHWLSPDEVKEAIYKDFEVAQAVTGHFKLQGGVEGGRLRLQLRRGWNAPEGACERVATHLARYSSQPVSIDFVEFGEFGEKVDMDYERKSRYV